METRTIEQVKVYCLVMNPVTDRAESGRIAALSFEKDKLIRFYEGEVTDSYDDDRFRKVFKKNGPLEWFNPVWTLDGLDQMGHGLMEDWVDSSNVQYLRTKYFFVS